MKKRLSDFIAGFLIVAQLFSGGVGIASVKAETSGEAENTTSAPDLSSLPTLPYDYNGPYSETHFLKDRVVFKNVNGEYMAFDVEDGAKPGLNLVWWSKWTNGYQSILPRTSLLYANFVPGGAYNAYKFIGGSWVYQNYVDDGNSFDFYADWVLAPACDIVYSTVDLINANGQVWSSSLSQWIDGSFEDYKENMVFVKDYTFALPVGVSTSAISGETVFVKTSPSPEYICDDGIDNDNDGFADKDDPGCHTDWNVGNLASYNPKARNEAEDNLKRVPIQSNGIELAAGSSQPTFSSDGRLISYISNTYTGGWYNNIRSDVFIYDTTTGVNERINLTPDGKDANGSSSFSSISGDGKYVAFLSFASNLVAEDTNGSADVFVYNREEKKTVLASRGLDGKPAGGAYSPSISANGQYVVFQSEAANMAEEDKNTRTDIFVYNIATGTVECASSASDGTVGDSYSFEPSVSADGRRVAFASLSTNFVAGDINGLADIFVKDLDTQEIERVNLSSEGKEGGEKGFSPAISPDGRYVTFISGSWNLVEDDTNNHQDVFVYNLTDHTIQRVSVNSNGEQANDNSYRPLVSENARYVIFSSFASNLTKEDTDNVTDVFIRDRNTQELKIVSISNEGIKGNSYSNSEDITPDGKYILISSGDGNLVKGDVNNATDTFIIKNPFWAETTLVPPTNLSQKNESDGTEAGIGRIINEGALESADSIFLSAKVEDSKGEKVSLEVEINNIDETGKILSTKNLTSNQVSTGEIASIDYTPTGGLYSWKARTINETGNKSDWIEFGNNSPTDADFISSNFSFVFLTDVHLGSLTTAVASFFGKNWYESQSYPRFTDVLYNIEQLNPRPDFILIGGDNVEYNNERWLEDFKSITGDFSSRTGIEIYFVPGNHDRYDSESTAIQPGKTDLSGGNDKLVNYFDVMKKPEGVISILASNPDIMNASQSEEGGKNRYNYYFYHDGFQIIGLDSGEDTGVLDFTPESEGLSESVIESLNELAARYPSAPRIIFMHNTAQDNESSYTEFDNDNILGGVIVPNGAISNNWGNFITYCEERGVQLVLSGHTHDSLVFDSSGNELTLSSWYENKIYPLYTQTQSAGKDDTHGYRVVEVQNGKAIPQDPVKNIPKYEKVFSDLDSKRELDLLVYDSNGKKITMDNSGKATPFFATNSKRIILYDDTEDSNFEVKNNNSFDTAYDLQLQKREEGSEINEDFIPTAGYRLINPELCGPSEILCSNFIYLKKKSDYTILGLEDIRIRKNSSNILSVDWSNISADSLPDKMNGINLEVNGNPNTTYSVFPATFTADLGSPGELRVYDKEGRMTGLVNGEIVEDIPYSIYAPESETVYVFGNTEGDVVDGLRTQVVGSYEATYDLTLALSENDEEKAKFTADDIETNSQTTHQFSIDWESLKQGKNGVTMQFDENKNGQFERTLTSDSTLTFPKAKLTADKYTTTEGTAILFDASPSTSTISLYEWDFNG
ncbi:MAG: metallophosphoesterase, partial [Patescibacteria group bacterium]